MLKFNRECAKLTNKKSLQDEWSWGNDDNPLGENFKEYENLSPFNK